MVNSEDNNTLPHMVRGTSGQSLPIVRLKKTSRLIGSEKVYLNDDQYVYLAGICTTAAPTQKLPSKVPRFYVVSPTTRTFRTGWWEILHMTRYASLKSSWIKNAISHKASWYFTKCSSKKKEKGNKKTKILSCTLTC